MGGGGGLYPRVKGKVLWPFEKGGRTQVRPRRAGKREVEGKAVGTGQYAGYGAPD